LAYLYQTAKIDYVVSEDSDLFAFNCYNIIKDIKMTGKCKVLEFEKKKHQMKHKDKLTTQKTNYSIETWRNFC